MAEPSKKTEQMENELTRLVGGDRRIAITHNKCFGMVGCGRDIDPTTEFRDEISRREYTISGLCQKCQDEIFGT